MPQQHKKQETQECSFAQRAGSLIHPVIGFVGSVGAHCPRPVLHVVLLTRRGIASVAHVAVRSPPPDLPPELLLPLPSRPSLLGPQPALFWSASAGWSRSSSA